MWVLATLDEAAENRRKEEQPGGIGQFFVWLTVTLMTGHFEGFISKNRQTILVCLKCGTAKHGEVGELCCCGESLVELVEAKWIEDETLEDKTNPGYPLIGGYFLVQTSTHGIEIRPRENTSNLPIIQKKVVQIACDKRFILAKRLGFTGGLPDDTTFEFWILDTQEARAIGPLDKQQFRAKQKELGLTGRLSPFLIPVDRLPKLPTDADTA